MTDRAHPCCLAERCEPRLLYSVITVTSLADVVADDGKVTLREAITAANTNKAFHDAPAGAGADTIQFAPSLFQSGAQTLVMNVAAFDISSPITIDGPGAGQLILCAVSRSRVFNIDDGTSNAVSVTLDGLTLTQGRIDDGSGDAVFNAENLTITRCTVSDSLAGMNGGGIASTGRLGMGDSLVTGNTAGAFGGGIYLASALFPAPDAITKSTVSNNSAATGGGVAADGSLAVAQSTFNQNKATGTQGDGGAIWSSTALSVV